LKNQKKVFFLNLFLLQKVNVDLCCFVEKMTSLTCLLALLSVVNGVVVGAAPSAAAAWLPRPARGMNSWNSIRGAINEQFIVRDH
jgi:sugar phosphate permease